MSDDRDRPDVEDVRAVLEHVCETDDVVMCQPRASGITRYLWGREDGGVFLMKAGTCNYAGDDAVERYQTMLDWNVDMRWRDASESGVMDRHDDQMRRADAPTGGRDTRV